MATETFGAGVFARNHIKYLNRACGKRALFRSQRRWVGARELLAADGAASIYLCPIPGDGLIHFAGKLVAVEIDPSEASMSALLEKTKARNVAPKEEALWNGACQTLYVVEIEPLTEPFPMTELVKLNDGQPLSADYGYSYSLVRRNAPQP